MAEPRYACASCGTWECADCGWKRPGASLHYGGHTCGRCPSLVGVMTVTMHTERMWRLHNDPAPLPEPYPYGERPAGPPYGMRTAEDGPDFYQDVRVPKQGPYQRFDLTSWKRGVDDCLKRYPREGERQP